MSDTGADAFDQRTAWKIDLIICKSRPFSQEEFGRRRRVVFEGLTLWIATVEDVLIAKLEWASKANPGASSTTAPNCSECAERNWIEPIAWINVGKNAHQDEDA